MKRHCAYILGPMVLALLVATAVFAVDYPHNTANGYTCSGCHQSHSTLGTQGYTNLCLTCHNPADGKAGNKAFVPGDASNPFGNATSARPGILYQSSHNWSGSDNVPPAGALPPLNPQMTKPNMAGTISCVRCHNVKNPRSSAFNSAPFLRALNERDEMCLDCHRLRNSSSHLSGSHPVTVSYSGAAKARPTAFQAVPANSNPGNPSSALKLVSGQVLCSTCHRVHFADSNSATYDSATSARQGHLAPSAGKLLRTDLRGASATAPNICSDCHGGKASHNNKGQNVQCGDCHSGHVAYDANAVTDQEKLPNVFLIRRYMNFSSSAGAVRNKRVFFQYTGSARNYVDYRGTGVCQGCHAVPQGAGYPIEHTSTDANVCATCHGHQSTFGSFAANCAFCHGFPPPAAAAGYTGVNETTSPHRRHVGGGVNYQYSCNECHKGNSHITGTFQDLFRDRTGILAGSSATYDTATRTCSGTYCHSKGTSKDPPYEAPMTTATWGGTTLDCAGCHKKERGGLYAQASPLGMDSGSHLPHILRGFVCAKCHRNTVTGNSTIASSANHVNKLVDVAIDNAPLPNNATYNGATAAAKTPGTAYSQCGNTYCHSNAQPNGGNGPPSSFGAPVWGSPATAACGSCHKETPDSGSHNSKHMRFGDWNHHSACYVCHWLPGYVGDNTCSVQCHDGAGNAAIFARHANGKVENAFMPKWGPSASYSGTPTPGDGYGRCLNTYCHSNGTSVATGVVPINTSPNWGSSPLTCDGCHGNPPAYVNNDPKANSHLRHNFGCNSCHSVTTIDGIHIAWQDRHVNQIYNIDSGAGASFIYTFSNSGGSCSSISCHGNTTAKWGSTSCLGCHSIAQGNRAAVTSQFGGNSHHVQGELTDAKCYQCHWEANSDGTINPAYHGGAAAPGSPVDLVVYGAAARPTTFTAGATAVQYTADGSRGQIEKVTSHCLGCHSDQNNSATPFGDGKTPKQYAWDGTSVAARYAQTGTTTWGKYSSVANAAQKRIAKSLSAHGNAAGNQRGWNTTTGIDGAITNTGGTTGVQCYDCHNSHGSSVAGITSRYSSATGNKRGGLLKETVTGVGGYATSYKPQAGGTVADKNVRNPGASICLDCHLNQTATSTPWGYGSTYGATQAILGYWDAPRYKDYSTSGAEQRYPFKKKNPVMGGHFGASAPLSSTPMGSIDGLCTPCHDPHGVSPTLGANQQYAVPLLKGTWLTSPYKEDTAPRDDVSGTIRTERGFEGVPYHIDQNTFVSGGVTQSVSQSAGLCIGCHPKTSLTNGTTHTWKSKDRVHESVMDWKTAAGTRKHNYSCSKCHSPHDSSILPRLMVTNCLDGRHKGRSAYNPSPAITGDGSGDYQGCYGMAAYSPTCWEPNYLWASGSGRIPGNYWGGDGSNNQISCHEGNTGSGTDQGWNVVTPWALLPPPPSAPTAISATAGNMQVTISWTDGTGSTSSLIKYGTTSETYSTTIDPAVSPRLIAGLTNGTPIYYRVGARNAGGITWSAAEYSVTPVPPPTVTSPTATAIGSTTATLGANVTSDGGAALAANGTCWGLTTNPTTNCVDQGSHVTGVFTQSRTGLTEGSLVYYRGYATNSVGTGYSPSGTIYTEPTQPNTLSFTSVGAAGITVNWATGSSGNAKNVIVVMRSGSAVNADPVDGVTYTANAAFGNGTQIGTLNYVVYKGTGTSVAVTGLSPSTTYYVKVYAFAAGVNGTENYNIASPLAGSQTTSTPTAPTLTLPTATAIGTTTATLGANVASNGGTALTANGTCWGSTATPTTNCIDHGSHATGIFTHARTGLTAGTKLYYRGYATNSAGPGYSPDGSFYTEPSTQASGVNFTAAGSTGMTVNWTRGDGDEVIVVMKQGTAVNSDPADGTYTGYMPNSVFGGGTQIGAGNYVMYKGTGTSVAVTGLAAGTTYYVAVYEYQGTVDTSGVNQGANYKPTPATGSQATSPGTTPPAVPTLLGPYSGYSGQVGYSDEVTPLVILQWNASSGATEYYCEVLNYGTVVSSSGWTTALSHDPGDLPDNTDYDWHVKARNASGESGWSETWTWYDAW